MDNTEKNNPALLEGQGQYMLGEAPLLQRFSSCSSPLLGPFAAAASVSQLPGGQGEKRRRQWQPTPVLLPGKSHGWRSLVGCSPQGCTESDTTEATQQQQQQGTRTRKLERENGGFLLLFLHFCFLVFESSWRVMLGSLCALQCSNQIFKVHPIQTGNIQAKLTASLLVF